MGEPALRIYDDEAPPTLLERLDPVLELEGELIKPSTRRNLRKAASLWDEFTGKSGSGTTSTTSGSGAISEADVALFRNSLMRDYAASTCRTHLSNLAAVLAKVGMPAAKVTKPSAPKPRKKIIPPSHLAAIYQACSEMDWPDAGWCSPVAAWRCLIAVLTSLGLRTEDAKKIRKTVFVLDPTCPDPDVTGEHAIWRNGWADIRAKKTERHARDVTVPLNDVLLRHVEPLIHASPGPLLLPFDVRKQRFEGGDSEFESTHGPHGWKHLMEVAGLEEHGYLPKHFRKTCETAYNGLPGKMGKWITGHCPTGTSEVYYDQVIPGMKLVINEMPLLQLLQPQDRQMRLF